MCDLSSLAGDQTLVPDTGRQTPNHWTTREGLPWSSLMSPPCMYNSGVSQKFEVSWHADLGALLFSPFQDFSPRFQLFWQTWTPTSDTQDQKYFGFPPESWLPQAMQIGVQCTQGKIHINMNHPVELFSSKDQSSSSFCLVLAAFQCFQILVCTFYSYIKTTFCERVSPTQLLWHYQHRKLTT